MTLHIFLDPPEPEVLRRCLRVDDEILDLSVLTPTGPLRRAFPEHTWHETDVASDASMRLGRDATLRWLTALPGLETSAGRLRDLLRMPDGFQLWWTLPMTARALRLHSLPQTLLRLTWLETQRLPTSDDVLFWAKDARAARAVAQTQGWVRWSARDPATGDALPTTHARPGVFRPWQALGRFLRVDRAIARREHSAQAFDILIPTVLQDWTDAPPPRHRYLHELAQGLADHGHRPAWLALTSLPDTVAPLQALLERQDLPFVWAAPGSVTARWRQLRGLDKRLRPVLGELEAHPMLRHDAGANLSGWLLEELRASFAIDAMKYLYFRDSVEAAIARHNPKMLLYRNEFYLNGRAIAAGAKSIPRWAMQHGLITEDHWLYLYTREELEGPDPLPAPTRFLSYGPYTEELMGQWGARVEHTQTGSLRHDPLFERAERVSEDARGAARERLGLPTDQPILAIFTQLVAHIPDWLERVVEGVRRAGVDAHIVVKQHPYHRDDALVTKTLERLNFPDVTLLADRLEDLLLAAHVALTENSTVGLEAAILGMPMISLRAPGRYVSFPWVEDGLAWDADTPEAMERALQEALSEEGRAAWRDRRGAFLRRHMINIDRPALGALLASLP